MSTVGSVMCSNLATGKTALVVDVTKVRRRQPGETRVLPRPATPVSHAWQASVRGGVCCTVLAMRRPRPPLAPQIKFSPIPEDSIGKLIEEGEVLWCAGALMVEHPLVSPHVQAIHGGMDAVMGLSKPSTLKVLSEAAEP